jgi:hypothetical protein
MTEWLRLARRQFSQNKAQKSCSQKSAHIQQPSQQLRPQQQLMTVAVLFHYMSCSLHQEQEQGTVPAYCVAL